MESDGHKERIMKIPGRLKWENIVCKRGITANMDMWKWRQDIVDGLFSGMLSARFSEIAQKPDAPFLGAGVGRESFIAHTKEEAALSARVKEDGIEKGIDALLTEVERVSRFGFDRSGKRLAASFSDTTAIVYDLESMLKPAK